MSASQDFRDGAATGAATLANRINQLTAWGVTVDRKIIDALTGGIAYEMGGRVYEVPE